MSAYEKNLFEAVPCGIVHFSLEENPRILDFNGACAQIYGFCSKEEFWKQLAGSFENLVYSYDTEFLKGYIRRAVHTGQPVNFGHRILRQNQTIGYIMGTLSVIETECGEQILQSIFQDSGQHIMQADIRKSIYYQSVENSINTKKIILADENQNRREQLCSALGDEYIMLQAGSIGELLTVLRKEGEEIAAILLTSSILTEQEYRFIATLRGSILYATIPLIVLNEEAVPMEEVLSYGVNDVLYPPYNINVIRMRLANLIELRNTAVQRNAIETLINNLSGGVLIFKIGEKVFSQLYYTDGILALAGMDRQEAESIINSGDWRRVIYEKDAKRIEAQLHKVALTGEPLELTFRIRQKDKSLSWVHMHGTKVKDEEEGIIYQCIVSPTSAGEKLYTNIMNDSFNGIAVYGEHKDDLLYFNNAVVPLLGENLQEVFAEPLPEDKYIQKQILLPESRKHITLNGKSIDWNGIRAKIIYATDDTDSYRIQMERHQLYEMERTKLYENTEDLMLSAVFNINEDRLVELGTDDLLKLEANRNYTISACVEQLCHYAASQEQAEQFRREYSAAVFSESYRNGETKGSAQYKISRADGGFRWVAISWVLVENPVTLELYAFLYMTDIDWEVIRQESFTKILGFEEEFVACLDLASEKIRLMELTEDSRVLDRGQLSYDTFRNRFWENLVSEKEQAQLWQLTAIDHIKEELAKEPVYCYYYQKKEAKGGRRRKKVRVFYLDETQDILCFTRTDVTDLQEEQQRQNEQLEAALVEAEQANKAKSMFLSRMSHDIRTPMNAILGMSRLALNMEGNPLQVQDYLEKILASGNYLLGLINDILDMSRIESDRVELDPEPCSLKSCVDFVLVTLKMQMEEKQLQFSYTENSPMPEYVMLDKLRIQQIFFNLISNAVKFSEAKGRIQVEVTPGELKDGMIETDILVRDEGIGIAREEQEKVFEAFEQGTNQGETRWQGTGLGLAIVRNLIRIMGGSIQLESRLGEGTEFRIHLAFAEAQADGGQDTNGTELPKEYDFDGNRFLLVEDNAINREIAKTMLEYKNGQVIEAVNGQEALRILEASKPGDFDAVFMDMQMPVMGGIEATERIRAHERTDLATLPIIAMTANAFEEDIRRSKEAGMNAHIVKPVDIDVLYETLYKILLQGGKNKNNEGN